jgi:hypothetical protein
MEPPKLKKANRMWWQIWLGRLINTARHDPLPVQPFPEWLLERAIARQRERLTLEYRHKRNSLNVGGSHTRRVRRNEQKRIKQKGGPVDI